MAAHFRLSSGARRLWAAVALLIAPLVFAHPSGQDSCGPPPHGSFQADPAFATISVLSNGVPVTQYQAGVTYDVRLASSSGYRGFVLGVFTGSNPPSSFASTMAGSISPGTDGMSRAQSFCGGLTHVDNALKTLATARWTAPATSGTGPVQLWAMVVQCKSACSNNYDARASLSELVVASTTSSASPSPVPPSITATGTVAPSISSSASASASTGSSPAATPSRSVSVAPSSSSAATASSTMAASVSPSPTMAAYPSATALSAAVQLQWRLEDSASRPATVSTATQAAFLLSAPGNVWLGIARASCNNMINRGVNGGCSAPAAIGLPGSSSGAASASVWQSILGGKSVPAITQVPAGSYTLNSTRSWYDGIAGMSYTAFKRPLAATGHTSELAINATAASGWIWAVGSGPTFGYHASSGYSSLTLSPPPCSRSTTCSGRGTCVASASGSSESCVCDVGYTGPACSSCALGFAPAGGVAGAACAPESSAAADDVAVAVTIRLTIPYSNAGASGSQQRSLFVSALQSDIAGALGVPPSRVNITNLQAGSVIATFALLPPPASNGGATPSPSPAAAASPSPAQLSAAALAVRFAALFADSSSALFSGNLTSSIDTTTPPTFAPFGTSNSASAYAMSVALRSDLTLSWTTSGSGIRMQLAYSGGSGAWFAFGINDKAGMVGGDVILYQPGAAAGSQTQQYTITAESAAGVQRVASSAQPLSGVVTGRSSSGAVTVEWSRPLAAGTYAGARAIPASGSVPVLWAVGSSGQTTLARHAATGAGTSSLDFATGSLSSSAAASMRVAHGIMMTLAWGVLAPVGVMLARYAKAAPSKPCGKPLWFQSHRIVQSCAVLLSLIGFGIAIAMVQQAGSAHFGSAHGALGLAVVLLGALQPINAVFRPHPPKLGEARSATRLAWEIIHRIGGYGAVVGGAVAIFLGLARAGAAAGLSAAYGVLLGLLIAAALYREVLRRRAVPAGALTKARGGADARARAAKAVSSDNAAHIQMTPVSPSHPEEQGQEQGHGDGQQRSMADRNNPIRSASGRRSTTGRRTSAAPVKA